MKVILCCILLFILLACPLTAAISPLPAATKVAIVISTPTPSTTLEISGLRTLPTTTTPAQHTFSTFKMTSNPSGAQVYVLGNATDSFTPWIQVIPDNYHNPYPMIFVLKYDGYEDYIFEPVTINGGENVTLHADMVPLPTVTQTPQPATDQVVTIQATATQPPVTQAQNPVIIVQTPAAAATTSIPDTASSGSLSVTTTPAGAEIFIDNEMKGVSPAVLAGLSPGSHSLGIVKEGYRNISTTITIETGKTLDYSTGLIATAQSPGFTAVLACAVLLGFLVIRKRSG
jgi:hypothetical protein